MRSRTSARPSPTGAPGRLAGSASGRCRGRSPTTSTGPPEHHCSGTSFGNRDGGPRSRKTAPRGKGAGRSQGIVAPENPMPTSALRAGEPGSITSSGSSRSGRDPSHPHGRRGEHRARRAQVRADHRQRDECRDGAAEGAPSPEGPARAAETLRRVAKSWTCGRRRWWSRSARCWPTPPPASRAARSAASWRIPGAGHRPRQHGAAPPRQRAASPPAAAAGRQLHRRLHHRGHGAGPPLQRPEPSPEPPGRAH